MTMADDKMSAEELVGLEKRLRDRSGTWADGHRNDKQARLDRQAADAIASLTSRALKAEGELVAAQAKLTARAKDMLKARHVLVSVARDIEDEGGRVFFGSTNDADQLKDVAETFDDWNWDVIMDDGAKPDYIGDNANLRKENADLKREADRMRGALEEAERLYSTSGLLANDPACGAWINRTRDILKRAALSHQADDAGAVSVVADDIEAANVICQAFIATEGIEPDEEYDWGNYVLELRKAGYQIARVPLSPEQQGGK